MPTSPRRLSAHLALTLAAAAALLLLTGVACSDDGADRPDPTTTQPTTTLTQSQQDQRVLRRLTEDWYEAIQAVFTEGADPQTAEAFITGDYLAGFIADVEDRRAAGQSSRRGEGSRETIDGISVDGDRATVETCLVDANILLGPGGELLNDDVGTFRYRTTAERTSEGWRFTERTQEGDVEEGDQCGVS